MIQELDYVKRMVQPAVEDLECEHFGSHPDDPVILHHREMLREEGSFAVLNGDVIRERSVSASLGLYE